MTCQTTLNEIQDYTLWNVIVHALHLIKCCVRRQCSFVSQLHTCNTQCKHFAVDLLQGSKKVLHIHNLEAFPKRQSCCLQHSDEETCSVNQVVLHTDLWVLTSLSSCHATTNTSFKPNKGESSSWNPCFFTKNWRFLSTELGSRRQLFTFSPNTALRTPLVPHFPSLGNLAEIYASNSEDIVQRIQQQNAKLIHVHENAKRVCL